MGRLLFGIYNNDSPLSCKHLNVLVFAEDTNLTAINCTIHAIHQDLENVEKWLRSNKLCLNADETSQMNLHRIKYRSVRNNRNSFTLSNSTVITTNKCKYLGVFLDDKLCFSDHVQTVKNKISQESGIVSKQRHYVPRKTLTKNYVSNLKLIIQYGILVAAL